MIPGMAKTSAQLDAEIKAALDGAKHGIIGRAKTYDDKLSQYLRETSQL